VVRGFDMPIRVGAGRGEWVRLSPTEAWQTATLSLAAPEAFRVDENFYVVARAADGPAATSATPGLDR